MSSGPRVQEGREYESRIHEYRLGLGLTIAELCRGAKVQQASVSALANGTMSPIRRNGSLTESARKLCEFFRADPADVFPRYMCDIRRREARADILPFESFSERMARNPADICERRELAERMLGRAAEMLALDKRRGNADERLEKEKGFLVKWLCGWTCAEIGEEAGCTRAYVSFVLDRIFQKMARAALDLGESVQDAMLAKIALGGHDAVDNGIVSLMKPAARRRFLLKEAEAKERERKKAETERKRREAAERLAREKEAAERERRREEDRKNREALERITASLSRSEKMFSRGLVSDFLRSLGLSHVDVDDLFDRPHKRKGRRKKSSGPGNPEGISR